MFLILKPILLNKHISAGPPVVAVSNSGEVRGNRGAMILETRIQILTPLKKHLMLIKIILLISKYLKKICVENNYGYNQLREAAKDSLF